MSENLENYYSDMERRRNRTLKELLESEAFCHGVTVGINIFQQKVIMAHERKESLLIDGNLYYIQDGRERLQEVIGKMCK